MRRALRPGKRGAAGKRGRPLARHAPHVRGEPGAKPFVDDLLLGRGFVRSRAAPSLRSIESQPSTQGFVAPGADAATVAAAVVGGGGGAAGSLGFRASVSLFLSLPVPSLRAAGRAPLPVPGEGERGSAVLARRVPRTPTARRAVAGQVARPAAACRCERARGKEGESGRAPPGAAPRASATRLASSSASPRRRAFPGPPGLGRGEGEWGGEGASRGRGGGERWRAALREPLPRGKTAGPGGVVGPWVASEHVRERVLRAATGAGWWSVGACSSVALACLTS